MGARDDALASSQFRILTGNRHFTRQFLTRQGLDDATRGTVVWSQETIDLVVELGQNVFGNRQRVGRQPVFNGLLAQNLDVALLHERLDFGHGAISEEFGVVVTRVTTHHIDAALGHRLHERSALHLTDAEVIERDVRVDVRRFDQAVIGDDLDAGLLGFFDHVDQGRGVFRNDHENVDLFGDHVFNLGNLFGHIAVSLLDEDFSTQGLARCDEIVTVFCPAFNTQVVNRETKNRLIL